MLRKQFDPIKRQLLHREKKLGVATEVRGIIVNHLELYILNYKDQALRIVVNGMLITYNESCQAPNNEEKS